LLVEVKTGDDTFAKACWRFSRYFPKTPKGQAVRNLKRPNEKEAISMLPAHEFLATLTLTKDFFNNGMEAKNPGKSFF